MSRRHSIAEARHDLARIVHESEGGDPIELTRRGEPVAVMPSMGEYRRLAEGKRDFWKAYEEFRRGHDLSRLGIPPEEIARPLARTRGSFVSEAAYSLDTNVLSEPLRPSPDAKVLERLRKNRERLATESAVWHEMLFG
jgi:prevent-host-death family protein